MSQRKSDSSSATYAPVACSFYDHLELACVNGSELELHTEEGVVTGKALTLRIEDGAEVLVLESPTGSEHTLRLDRIKRVQVSAAGRTSAYDVEP